MTVAYFRLLCTDVMALHSLNSMFNGAHYKMVCYKKILIAEDMIVDVQLSFPLGQDLHNNIFFIKRVISSVPNVSLMKTNP